MSGAKPDLLARTFRLRAGRALVLGVLAMGAVAWIVSPVGVVAGLVCGVPLAVVLPRVARLKLAAFCTFGAAALGAVLGSIVLAHGALVARVVTGLVAACAVAPWTVVLALVLRARSEPSGQP